MERKLPTVTIHDTEFIIDLSKYELREVANPDNKIPLDKTWVTADATTIRYDKQTKNVYHGNWPDFLQASNTDLVVLPPLIELDRIGLLQSATTRELYDFAEQLNNKYPTAPPNGGPRVLPSITFEGMTFYIDGRLHEFRNKDNPAHRILFRETFPVDGDKTGFVFDPTTKNAFSGTREQFHQRNDLSLVVMPPLYNMMIDKTGQMFHATSRKQQQEDRTSLQKEFKRRKGRGI